MKSHRTTLIVAAALLAAFAAGAALGKKGRIDRLNLAGRSDSRPFSHAVLADDFIFVAGTLGLDPETRRPPEDPMAEARLALDGIRAKLALAGATMDDLVAVQIFCPDTALYEGFNEVYAGYFTKGVYPSRSFIGSGPLLFGSRFEINGIALKR